METIIHEPKERNGQVPKLVTTPYSIDPLRRKVDLDNFIYVPQEKIFITREPIELTTRLNWEDTHFFLADRGLFMPTISTFVRHYMNVRNAAQDRKALYHASGKEITINNAWLDWNFLNSCSSQKGSRYCTWLDNKWEIEFEDRGSVWYTETEHRVKMKKGSPTMQGKRIEANFPRAQYPFHTKLPLTEIGTPDNWAKDEEIAPGITLKFITPEKGSVTQYYAEEGSNQRPPSGVINCTKDPGAGPSHVFACAYSTRSFSK